MLADRMTYAEAVEAVGKLLGAFPNGSPANAKGYIGALAAVLVDSPKSIAIKCADPLQGVARETRFLPTVADLVAWIEREKAGLLETVARDDFNATAIREAQQRRDEAVRLGEARKARPTYAELKAKYGDNWGIGKPESERKRIGNELAAARLREANETFLQREYAAAGVDPIDAGHGIAVSPELHRRIQETCPHARRAPHREAAE